MNARILGLVTACTGAVLAILVLAARPAAPARTPAPNHGAFATRLQPLLEGIGSTRALTPVPLDDADQAAPSPGQTPKAERHEPRGRR